MQVWFPLEGETPQKMLRKDRSLEFDTEVYPVGFVPELGFIVGVTQGVSYTVLPDSPCFELRTKVTPHATRTSARPLHSCCIESR